MAPDPRQLRSQRFPLHAAVENGDITRVRGLLEGAMGSQVNRKYETSGQTPLHIAASSGCPAIIQLLLDAGAAVDELDCVKQTPLHYSITNTRWGVMESLVKAGANVNARRMKDGWTPLFLAGIFGLSYKVQYLLDSGADVLLCDERGLTVMDWVGRYRVLAVQASLKQAPRRVTEMSGKKYVEAEAGDKLEVPVEFDEGINKLLAKLEIKRKARIAEHKNLLIKMEKEKVEEKKVLEERIEETAVESEDQLSAATDNILQRQKRFLQEMEGQEQTSSPTSTPTQTQILPKNESKENVDLIGKSSEDASPLSTLVVQLSSDQRVSEKRTKINISCDKTKNSININGSFKASIDALFEKTAASTDNVDESEDLLIKENSPRTLNIDSQRIPEIVDNPCNLETSKQVSNATSNEMFNSVMARPIEAHDKEKDDIRNQNHSKLADKRNLTTLLSDGDSINSREKQKIQTHLESGEIEKKSDLQIVETKFKTGECQVSVKENESMNEKAHSDEKSKDNILGIPDYDKDKCAEINQKEKRKSTLKENGKSPKTEGLNIQTENKTQIAEIKRRENPDAVKTKIIKNDVKQLREGTVESGDISGKGRSDLNEKKEKIQLRVQKEKKRNTKEKKRDISEVEGGVAELEQKCDDKAGDGKIGKIFEAPHDRTKGGKNNQDVLVDQPEKKDLNPDSEIVKYGPQPASTSMTRNLLENEQFQYNSNSDIIQNVENNSNNNREKETDSGSSKERVETSQVSSESEEKPEEPGIILKTVSGVENGPYNSHSIVEIAQNEKKVPKEMTKIQDVRNKTDTDAEVLQIGKEISKETICVSRITEGNEKEKSSKNVEELQYVKEETVVNTEPNVKIQETEGKKERLNEQIKCDITEMPKNIPKLSTENTEKVGKVLIQTDVQELAKEMETKETIIMRAEKEGKTQSNKVESNVEVTKNVERVLKENKAKSNVDVLPNSEEKEVLKETVVQDKENGVPKTRKNYNIAHVPEEVAQGEERKESVTNERRDEEGKVFADTEMPPKSPHIDSQAAKASAGPVEGSPEDEVKLSCEVAAQSGEKKVERQSCGNISVSVVSGEPSTPASLASPGNSQQTENNILEETKDNIQDIQQHQMEQNVKIYTETKSLPQIDPEKINLQPGGQPPALSDQKKEPPVVSDQIKEPPVVSDQIKEPPVVSDQIKEPPVVSDQKKEPPVVSDQIKEPPVVSDQIKEPPVVSDQIKEPPVVSDQIKEPPVVSDQIKEPPVVSDQIKEPPVVSDQIKEPPVVSDQIKEPPVVSDQIKEPPVVSDQIKEPPLVSDQTKEPPVVTDQIKDEIKSAAESSAAFTEEDIVLSIDDHIKTVNLPEHIDDAEFTDKLKVFNNYRNFGAMYFAKNNFKKAEWAFKNGIKQSTSGIAKSKDQLRQFLSAEVEFRLCRARCCQSLLLPQEAVKECKAILKIESNKEASDLLKTL